MVFYRGPDLLNSSKFSLVTPKIFVAVNVARFQKQLNHPRLCFLLVDFVCVFGVHKFSEVVPQSWIFSDTRDSDVVSALREVGILEEQQAHFGVDWCRL